MRGVVDHRCSQALSAANVSEPRTVTRYPPLTDDTYSLETLSCRSRLDHLRRTARLHPLLQRLLLRPHPLQLLPLRLRSHLSSQRRPLATPIRLGPLPTMKNPLQPRRRMRLFMLLLIRLNRIHHSNRLHSSRHRSRIGSSTSTPNRRRRPSHLRSQQPRVRITPPMTYSRTRTWR